MDAPHEARTHLIANARAKLTTADANGIAIAVRAVGGLAPLFSQRSAAAAQPDRPWLTPVLSLLCLCVRGVLPWAARGFLRELRSWIPIP